MSHIYVFSPSSAERNKVAIRRGIARLRAMGHEVELDAAALGTHMRFAGDDEARLAAIKRAAASGADIAMTTRGGYGLTRLLPNLPYKAIKRAVDKGTRFLGLSDFTALQNAVFARTGAITWAGPMLGEDFGTEGEPDEIMQACFHDLLTGQAEGAGWQLPTSEVRKNGFRASGTLWGGNLSVLVSLVGTPWIPEVKGGVLFLEDVSEHPYRVERMLTQLLHSGILGRQKAILLGQFTNYKPAPNDKGFRLQTAVDWVRSKVKIPVFTCMPFGHVPTKVCLPVGASVHLVVEKRDALILWGHAY